MINPGFETQGRHHQKYKTGVSAAPRKYWCPPKRIYESTWFLGLNFLCGNLQMKNLINWVKFLMWWISSVRLIREKLEPFRISLVSQFTPGIYLSLLTNLFLPCGPMTICLLSEIHKPWKILCIISCLYEAKVSNKLVLTHSFYRCLWMSKNGQLVSKL